MARIGEFRHSVRLLLRFVTYRSAQWNFIRLRFKRLNWAASLSNALPKELHLVQLRLKFRQYSFCLALQVLRSNDFSIFSSSSALPPCYFPLSLSSLGKVVNLCIHSKYILLMQQCHHNCHGARQSYMDLSTFH